RISERYLSDRLLRARRALRRLVARREAVRLGERPDVAIARIVGAGQELARREIAIDLVVAFDARRRQALGEMARPQLLRMLEAGGGDDLAQRQHGRAVEVMNPLRLVGNDEGALAGPVLGRDAGRAAVGM